jgi:hypothetical protein
VIYLPRGILILKIEVGRDTGKDVATEVRIVEKKQV